MKADLITRPATTTHTHTQLTINDHTMFLQSRIYQHGLLKAYGAHYLEISAALIELHAEVEWLV